MGAFSAKPVGGRECISTVMDAEIRIHVCWIGSVADYRFGGGMGKLVTVGSFFFDIRLRLCICPFGARAYAGEDRFHIGGGLRPGAPLLRGERAGDGLTEVAEGEKESFFNSLDFKYHTIDGDYVKKIDVERQISLAAHYYKKEQTAHH